MTADPALPHEPVPPADVSDDAAMLAYLDAARITGRIATPREANLAHIGGFLEGLEHLEFGVERTRDWTWDEVFAVMVERAGLDPDRAHEQGQDTLSAERCLAALKAYGRRFGQAVRAGEPILFATGHPAGLFPIYQDLAAAARAAGTEVLRIREGIRFLDGDLRQINDVVMFEQYGSLAHTHFSEPMRLVLDQLAARGVRPGLVVADHGWAGTAASAGLPTLGIADSNDPGLFVSEAQGQILVAVPMDDNVLPHLYRPVTDLILFEAGLGLTRR